MANLDVKKAINNSKLKFWQVASQLGITDSTFSRKLRKEFSAETKEKIFSIIKSLKEGEKSEQ